MEPHQIQSCNYWFLLFGSSVIFSWEESYPLAMLQLALSNLSKTTPTNPPYERGNTITSAFWKNSLCLGTTLLPVLSILLLIYPSTIISQCCGATQYSLQEAMAASQLVRYTLRSILYLTSQPPSQALLLSELLLPPIFMFGWCSVCCSPLSLTIVGVPCFLIGFKLTRALCACF